MSTKTVACIYNPRNQSPGELIDHFVVRQKIFEKIFEDIRTSDMKYPEQHYMIEGKRGMGKTTLLLRLAYAIEQDEQLNKWLIPLNFNEEEYSVRKLFRLWERIIQLLEDANPVFKGLFAQAEKISRIYKSDEEYERELYKLLELKLQANGKKIILFIDNFGDMVQKFSDLEAHRLRKILQISADIRIIAASSIVLEAFYQYNHPFYEFFKVERLEGLSMDESRQLLLQLGKIYGQGKVKHIVEEQTGRIEALRRLTGGVTRTIILLFEIFVDDQNGDTFLDLERVLDRVTPLYKHRMDDLPAQQQQIVEAIALNWDAISVKEIQARTRIPSKVISALLQQLVKNEIVGKIKTQTKNHLYQINERFFNIWYLMRHGRHHDRQKVLWLVRFLEEWCSDQDIKDRAAEHIRRLKKGDYNPRGAYYMSEALAYTNHLPSTEQHQLLEVTRDFLQERKSSYFKKLSKSDVELLNKATVSMEQKSYRNALDYLLKMKDKDDARIAWVYHNGMRDIKMAEKHYRKAARKGSVAALNNLGVIYEYALNDPTKAEALYLRAAEHKNVNALHNLGSLYKNKLKNYKKAEKYYLKYMESSKRDPNALFSIGNLYANGFDQPDKAVEYYEAAAEKGQVLAMSNLAFMYLEKYDNPDEAERYFMMALDQGLLYNEDFIDIASSHPINFHLLFLLARGQEEFLYQHFNSERGQEVELKDRLKPIYYAAAHFLKDQHPNEILRMGDELKETVMEVVERVVEMKKVFE